MTKAREDTTRTTARRGRRSSLRSSRSRWACGRWAERSWGCGGKANAGRVWVFNICLPAAASGSAAANRAHMRARTRWESHRPLSGLATTIPGMLWWWTRWQRFRSVLLRCIVSERTETFFNELIVPSVVRQRSVSFSDGDLLFILTGGWQCEGGLCSTR